MTIQRSLPYGSVNAVLTKLHKLGLEQLISSRPCHERDLLLSMNVDRVVSPRSILSYSRGMKKETAQNTLAEELNPGNVDVHEFYDTMDWLLERQNRIENKLAKKDVKGDSLVLFDVSSSYNTCRKSSLRQYGYSGDYRTD